MIIICQIVCVDLYETQLTKDSKRKKEGLTLNSSISRWIDFGVWDFSLLAKTGLIKVACCINRYWSQRNTPDNLPTSQNEENPETSVNEANYSWTESNGWIVGALPTWPLFSRPCHPGAADCRKWRRRDGPRSLPTGFHSAVSWSRCPFFPAHSVTNQMRPELHQSTTTRRWICQSDAHQPEFMAAPWLWEWSILLRAAEYVRWETEKITRSNEAFLCLPLFLNIGRRNESCLWLKIIYSADWPFSIFFLKLSINASNLCKFSSL